VIKKAVMMKLRFLFVLMLMSVGCAHSLKNSVKDTLKSKGTVLKEWTEEPDDYLILKEGARITKYRIYNWNAGGVMGTYGANAEPLYVLDTSIKECFAGQVSIPCEKIAKDKDMKPFLEQYLK
jgi:hypothetical protein